MELKNLERDRFRGALLGLACGDALGVQYTDALPLSMPETATLRGGGPIHLAPGEWTAPTAMALCLSHSLLIQSGFDADDQMSRYQSWRKQGYQSSTGRCVGLDKAMAKALDRYQQGQRPYNGVVEGRSSLSGINRLAPIPMFFAGHMINALHYCARSHDLTHNDAKSADATMLLGLYLYRALQGASKGAVLAPPPEGLLKNVAVDDLASASYRSRSLNQLRNSPYVIDALEAALWCFWSTDSFEDAVMCSARLGGDASACAALTGQLAGAYYGASMMPTHWLDCLTWNEDIQLTADQVFELSGSGIPVAGHERFQRARH